MMMFSHFLITGLGADSQTNYPGLIGQSYVSITFAGQTSHYTSVNAGLVTERDSTRFWYVNLGADSDYFLSIGVCGSRTGAFPFGNDQARQSDISLITYNLRGSVYSSYYDFSADYTSSRLLTQGEVHIEELENRRLTRGTFSGTLLPINDPENQPDNAMLISGRFHLYQ